LETTQGGGIPKQDEQQLDARMQVHGEWKTGIELLKKGGIPSTLLGSHMAAITGSEHDHETFTPFPL
jgi:hypothetical protein